MDLLKLIYDIPDDVYRENYGFFREVPDLVPSLNTPVPALSLGQRIRADLCAALLIQLSARYRIVDLDVRDQPIEDIIPLIYEDQLLYNQSHGEKNSPL